MKRFLCLASSLLFLVLLNTFSSFAQQKSLSFSTATMDMSAPVRVTTAQIEKSSQPSLYGKYTIQLNSLEKLSFQVQNNSEQRIKYVQLKFLVPKTTQKDVFLGISFSFGKLETTSTGKVDFLNPRQQGEVFFEAQQAGVSKLLLSDEYNPDKAILVVDYVLFEDGTLWHIGQMLKPNGKGSWVVASEPTLPPQKSQKVSFTSQGTMCNKKFTGTRQITCKDRTDSPTCTYTEDEVQVVGPTLGTHTSYAEEQLCYSIVCYKVKAMVCLGGGGGFNPNK